MRFRSSAEMKFGDRATRFLLVPGYVMERNFPPERMFIDTEEGRFLRLPIVSHYEDPS
jgi:hypothetical protein